MNVFDLMIGKKVSVKTNVGVAVELEIKSVTEQKKITTRDLEPSNAANDWWPAQEVNVDKWFDVEFTNGHVEKYSEISKIEFI